MYLQVACYFAPGTSTVSKHYSNLQDAEHLYKPGGERKQITSEPNHLRTLRVHEIVISLVPFAS
jgi:hypothetical protein